MRDVTERKRAEAERAALDLQLQDAQRWESLGVLAGGVAHDFNNILTVILGSAGLARRGLPPGAPALGYLDQIEQASRRAADVCRHMLAYAGRTQSTGTRADLAALVRDAAPLLQIPAGHAAVRLDLADRLPPLAADPAQVRQVLLSLVTNAAEAVAGTGGEVTVRAGTDEVPERRVGVRLPPGPAARPVRRPDRLGHRARHGGGRPRPHVRPVLHHQVRRPRAGAGGGTRHRPRPQGRHPGGDRAGPRHERRGVLARRAGAVAPPAPPAPPARRARPAVAALVIDDELFVREVTASTLEEMGFAPLLAADGPSGLALFQAHRDAIQVAVIDVVMPGMTGDQVLAAIRATAPALPVVLVSGFTDRRVLPVGGDPHTEFLQKPFHPEDLMAVVRQLVG